MKPSSPKAQFINNDIYLVGDRFFKSCIGANIKFCQLFNYMKDKGFSCICNYQNQLKCGFLQSHKTSPDFIFHLQKFLFKFKLENFQGL